MNSTKWRIEMNTIKKYYDKNVKFGEKLTEITPEMIINSQLRQIENLELQRNILLGIAILIVVIGGFKGLP